MTFSRNHLALGSKPGFRLPCVAQSRQTEDFGLVEVLDRVEAAVHVAVERGIADRHFRFVAGRHHHQAELVGDRHQDHAARAGLEIFLGDVARPALEHRRDRLLQAQHRTLDRQDVVVHAERLGDLGGVVERILRGEPVRQHHAADAVGAKRIHRHHRAQRRVDAAGQAQHHALEAALLDVVAQPQHAGAVIGLVVLVLRA